jgi:hypothetical protein
MFRFDQTLFGPFHHHIRSTERIERRNLHGLGHCCACPCRQLEHSGKNISIDFRPSR